MRILSFLTAAIVAIALYFLIFQRDVITGGTQDEEEIAQSTAVPSIGRIEPPEGTIRVVGLASRAQTVNSGVRVRGKTEAARQVDVRAEISGRVVSEPIPKGTFVGEGQLLCSIDLGTRMQSLQEARALLAEAEVNQNAAQQLLADGFASQTRLKNAIVAVESATAAVAAAEKDIERTQIVAPFAGFLESDTAELGSLMQPGALCATVIQLDPIRLVAYVPEAEADRVSLGAEVFGEFVSAEVATGSVSFIARAADPATNTFRVEAQASNADFHIRDGQSVEMQIVSKGRAAHLIPGSALTLNDEGTLGVRVAEDGVARFRPVEVLRDTPDGVWISGLAQEVTVIIIGQEYVADGVPVAVSLREG